MKTQVIKNVLFEFFQFFSTANSPAGWPFVQTPTGAIACPDLLSST
jgi:hypothetical protein